MACHVSWIGSLSSLSQRGAWCYRKAHVLFHPALASSHNPYCGLQIRVFCLASALGSFYSLSLSLLLPFLLSPSLPPPPLSLSLPLPLSALLILRPLSTPASNLLPVCLPRPPSPHFLCCVSDDSCPGSSFPLSSGPRLLAQTN